MTQETFTFQAEVGKLLDIVAHSLYSQREIFLRELVSNAADACDKLRYLALTDPKLEAPSDGHRIELEVSTKDKTLTVRDNGIGMSKDDLNDLLGTIARSGTRAFAEQLAADKTDSKDKAMSLIGQFGVGFYSAFMVADEVAVVTRKAGDDAAWRWQSDGKGSYTIEESERAEAGTDVILSLKKDSKEFLEPDRLKTIIRTYSDHIGIPIVLKAIKKDAEDETLNTASALWTRDKKDITEDQYREFYHHVAHGFDDPWHVMHNRVEGVLSYTTLLFIPGSQPWDLFHPDRKSQLKLYVNRVFITDDCEDLVPSYLRFLRGVVDSEDLSLNVSREMMQRDPKLAKIRKGIVKRVLGELKKKADKAPDAYAAFWENFGSVLKEGIYEDTENRDNLLALARFKSTKGDDLVSLDDYIARMVDGQDAIYYITGDDAEKARSSPHLEGFKAKGVEVLVLTDPVDDFWISGVGAFQDKLFKSVTRGGADLDSIKDEDGKDDTADEKAPDGIEALVGRFKASLEGSVKDVRSSSRLTDSAVCLVADDNDLDIHMERLLRQHNQLRAEQLSQRILEVNPKHPLIKRLAGIAKDADGPNPTIEDAAHLLFDQARIVEGEAPADPQAFVRRFSQMLERGLAA
ncbi:MAG: molecular chaperone HtpG [Rhodospirillales bacterium]